MIKSNKQKGFTLTELLVSITIFSVVILIIGSAFIQVLRMQRKASNFQEVEENISFLLEFMSKEFRVSTLGPLPGGGDDCYEELTIKHPDHGFLRYSISNDQHPKLIRNDLTPSKGGPISSDAVEFMNLDFCVQGSGTPDQQQPRVTIRAGVRSVDTKEQSRIDVQTTISLRFLDDEGKPSPF